MFRLHTQDHIPNVKVDQQRNRLIVCSHFHIYGTRASEDLFPYFIRNVEDQWGHQIWEVEYLGARYELYFESRVDHQPMITAEEIHRNRDLRNIYVAIEESSMVHISFADGRGSNTGYFMLSNILQSGSTTIAHEYGHMLGLWPGSITSHPLDLDQRGQGMPGIMYPRGTIVDPIYQYDDDATPGEVGGTLDPKHRRVNLKDIDMLMKVIEPYDENGANLGKLTNKYHLPFLPDPVV